MQKILTCVRMLINKNTNKIRNSYNNHNSLEMWSKSRPTESEVIAIKKIMNLARQFQSNIIFCSYRIE